MISPAETAGIVFTCVAANHLGLVAAVESTVRFRLPVIGCVKCLTFWSVLAYGLATEEVCLGLIPALGSVALLSAWSAIWLDLLMGLADKAYVKIYVTIYPTEPAADADEDGAGDTLPGMQRDEGR